MPPTEDAPLDASRRRALAAGWAAPAGCPTTLRKSRMTAAMAQ